MQCKVPTLPWFTKPCLRANLSASPLCPSIWTVHRFEYSKAFEPKNKKEKSLKNKRTIERIAFWSRSLYVENTVTMLIQTPRYLYFRVIKDSRGILGASFQLADNSRKHPIWRPKRGENWQLKKTLNWKPVAWFYGIVYDVCVYEDL